MLWMLSSSLFAVHPIQTSCYSILRYPHHVLARMNRGAETTAQSFAVGWFLNNTLRSLILPALYLPLGTSTRNSIESSTCRGFTKGGTYIHTHYPSSIPFHIHTDRGNGCGERDFYIRVLRHACTATSLQHRPSPPCNFFEQRRRTEDCFE
jgi:hypothetical protein